MAIVEGITNASFIALYIEMLFNGNRLTTGTAFILKSKKGYLLITNRHNVTGRRQDNNKPIHDSGGIPNQIKIYHHTLLGDGKWFPKVQNLYDDPDTMENPLWFEHPIYGSQVDFVALKIEDSEEIRFILHELHHGQPDLRLYPSDRVSVIGFPFGESASEQIDQYYPIWMNGFLASEPKLNYKGLPLQLIDCRTRPGQSGSPVIAFRNGTCEFDLQGMLTVMNHQELIGIYSGRINEESDIGFVWKISAVIELINHINNMSNLKNVFDEIIMQT